MSTRFMDIPLCRWLLLPFLLVTISPASVKAGTWTQVFSDDFTRANSTTIGNNWTDPDSAGAISGNKLVLTVPAGGTGNGLRISRPVSEASLYQKIEASFIMPATNDGLAHCVYVRGKSLVFNGYETYPTIMVRALHNGRILAFICYRGGAITDGSVYTGPSYFTATAGNSYTLTVSVTNNFPAVVTARLHNNTTPANPDALITYNDLGFYGTTPKVHLSPDTKTPGVMGVSMEGAAAKSVSFTSVKTYAWSETGALTAPSGPVVMHHGGKTHLASPFPSGGTGPYFIRWYRGANNFTPPVTIDGSGAGTGTYLGNSFEQVDANPPAGVTNLATTYRAVYFDSGANATTGLLGTASNQNSPTVKSYSVPVWIGDSITAGYGTSIGKSPATYSQTYLNADSTYSAVYTNPINYPLSNLGFSGKTSGNLVSLLPRVLGQARLIGATFANIMLGANDSKNSVAASPAAYKANIQTIITSLKAYRPDIKIVLNKPLWFKPDTGYAADFSTASLGRIAQYRLMLDQLADGTNIVVGDLTASDELQTYGWTGTTGVANPTNGTTAYPPAPTGGMSYLLDGLHPYHGGAEMIAKLEWGSNAADAVFGIVTPIPVVDAGVNQTIHSPASSVTLTGSATHSNGTIAGYAWTKISGNAATILSPLSTTTQVTGLSLGVYVFRLTATDNKGATGTADVQVSVNP